MMKYMQRLGKSLMLPISVMPIAALLKGIGYWIGPVMLGADHMMAAFLLESGSAIIDNLPFLFAISIAVGMAQEKDITIFLSAVISYLLISRLLSPSSISLFQNIHINKIHQAFFYSDNAFIGIVTGLIVAFCYRRFSNVKLPQSLMFFSGKRFFMMISTVCVMMFSIIMLIVWPACYEAFVSFGKIMVGLGPLGAGIFGFFNRLLIPTGLHHALNSVVWFDVAGINDIGKFWGTIDGGIKGVTGIYQAGFFPVMMFGLPAAAFAIYVSARSEKKKQVGAILFSSAIASFITGITEPLEFSFMFVAPSLYFMHAFFTGVMLFITASFEWIAGFGFSAGLIDYVLSIKSPFANHVHMLIPLGIFCGVLYYVTFRFMIIKYNIMTPGREIDNDVNEKEMTLATSDYDELAIQFIEALGGRKNIQSVENCITRLRVELNDIHFIDRNAILSTGATGIVEIDQNNIQIIIGTEVEFIVEAMEDILM